MALAGVIGAAIGMAVLDAPGAPSSAADVMSEPDVLAGRASVVDGDTLDMRGERIRLSGVDAPEAGQRCEDADGRRYRCGQAAALALADHIGGRTVTCRVQDEDRYGRIVAKCAVDAQDLGEWLVRNGHAVDYVRL